MAGNIANFWHSSDLIERAIFLSLALMLVYAFFVFFLFFYRLSSFHLGKRAAGMEASAFARSQEALVVDFITVLGVLRGIATCAPFLGLAGTSYGILANFSRGFAMSRGSVLLILTRGTASTLIAPAIGILVAVPAVLIHNILRKHVERMQGALWFTYASQGKPESSFCRAQTLPLKRRCTGLPPFALIAAPVFAIVIMIYMWFKPYETPKGLHVRLLRIGSLKGDYRPSEPIIISMAETENGDYVLRVNSENVTSEHLEKILLDRLRLAPQRLVYIEADARLYWGSVANMIGWAKGLQCEVVLLTTAPARGPKVGRSWRP